jgi:lipopolysaccharide heptosyltransferase II
MARPTHYPALCGLARTAGDWHEAPPCARATLPHPAPSLFGPGLRRNVAVVQPLPGIGDMIWHLPHLRALATAAGDPVTLVAKPRSLANQLLAAEPAVRDIIWLDRNPEGWRGRHDGPLGLFRLVSELRARRFDAVVLLHHSVTLAAATFLAGIRLRAGYGYGAQRWLLNRGPVMSRRLLRQHQFQRATAWLSAAGIPMADPEPVLTVSVAARETASARLASVARPFVAIGIGASEPSRQWGAARFAALLRGLRTAGWSSLVLLGGPSEAAPAAEIQHLAGPDGITVALDWRLDAVAALLAEAAFYVGNNTGVMNMAAAVGIPTYALFGTTPVFGHSRHIIPIASPPDEAAGDDGMARITPTAVLAAIEAGSPALHQAT